MKLNERCRVFRKEKNIDMVEMAERVGVSYTILHHIETGRKKISPEVAHKISSYIDNPGIDCYQFFMETMAKFFSNPSCAKAS